MKRIILTLAIALLCIGIGMTAPASAQDDTDVGTVINATVYNESGDAVGTVRFEDRTLYQDNSYGWEANIDQASGNTIVGYGDNLRSNGTTIESFEDGDISEYIGGTGYFETTTSPVADGSYSLQMESDGNHVGIVKPSSEVETGPRPGTTFSYQMRLDDDGTRNLFAWAVNESSLDSFGYVGEGYVARLSNRDSQEFAVRRRSGGASQNGDGVELANGIQQGEWYTVEITWSEFAYNVSGYVRDEGGNPIDNADVTFDEGPTVTTDSDGFYSAYLENGTYSYSASAGGYETNPDAGTVTVDGAAVDNVNATLSINPGTLSLTVPERMEHNETTGYSVSAAETVQEAWSDSFEDEPLDTGVPDEWEITDTGGTHRVRDAIASDGSQSYYVNVQDTFTGSRPEHHPLSSPQTDNISFDMYVFTESSDGSQARMQSYGPDGGQFSVGIRDGDLVYNDGAGYQTLSTAVGTDAWVSVTIYDIDPSANTVSVAWSQSGNSGTATNLPINGGLTDGYNEVRYRVFSEGVDYFAYIDDVHIGEATRRTPDVTVTSGSPNVIAVDEGNETLQSFDESGSVDITASATINGTTVAVTEEVSVASITLSDVTLLPASWALLAIVTDFGFVYLFAAALISAAICRASGGDDYVCVGIGIVTVIFGWAVLDSIPIYLVAVALLGLGLLLFGDNK